MGKKQRTDLHRPGAIIPAHYTHVLSYGMPTTSSGHLIPSIGLNCEVELRREERDADGKIIRVVNGEHASNGRCCVFGLRAASAVFAVTGGPGTCSVCGAHYVHGDVWRHDPTGEHIHIGHDCADKYAMLVDRSAYELARDQVEAAVAREIQRIANAEERAEFLAANPGLDQDLAVDHDIIRDIAVKFQQYRHLSEKQIALVRKIADEVRNPKPAEQHVPAPTGRVTFRGTVVSRKFYDSAYGSTCKITIKIVTPSGSWLAWVTEPSDMLDLFQIRQSELGGAPWDVGAAVRGAEVEMTATLTRGKDAHFVLGKRPTKLVVYRWGSEPDPKPTHIDTRGDGLEFVPACGEAYQGGPIVSRDKFIAGQHNPCRNCCGYLAAETLAGGTA